MLKPRREVHRAADHGVVHAVFAAEIADGAIAGVNADPAAQRRLDAAVAPFLRQFADALLHGDRHLDAGQRIFLHAQRRRIAEEHDNGVTDIFVDGCAVLQRDLRHFGEVVIEQLREVFRLHLVGDLGETDEVGEANGELLALADDLDVLLAGEDRVVDLRRQVFCEFRRQRRQRRGLFRQVLLALLEFGDVGIDARRCRRPRCGAR